MLRQEVSALLGRRLWGGEAGEGWEAPLLLPHVHSLQDSVQLVSRLREVNALMRERLGAGLRESVGEVRGALASQLSAVAGEMGRLRKEVLRSEAVERARDSQIAALNRYALKFRQEYAKEAADKALMFHFLMRERGIFQSRYAAYSSALAEAVRAEKRAEAASAVLQERLAEARRRASFVAQQCQLLVTRNAELRRELRGLRESEHQRKREKEREELCAAEAVEESARRGSATRAGELAGALQGAGTLLQAAKEKLEDLCGAVAGFCGELRAGVERALGEHRLVARLGGAGGGSRGSGGGSEAGDGGGYHPSVEQVTVASAVLADESGSSAPSPESQKVGDQACDSPGGAALLGHSAQAIVQPYSASSHVGGTARAIPSESEGSTRSLRGSEQRLPGLSAFVETTHDDLLLENEVLRSELASLRAELAEAKIRSEEREKGQQGVVADRTASLTSQVYHLELRLKHALSVIDSVFPEAKAAPVREADGAACAAAGVCPDISVSLNCLQMLRRIVDLSDSGVEAKSGDLARPARERGAPLRSGEGGVAENAAGAVRVSRSPSISQSLEPPQKRAPPSPETPRSEENFTN